MVCVDDDDCGFGGVKWQIIFGEPFRYSVVDGMNYQVLHKIPIKYHLLLLDVLNLMYLENIYPGSSRTTYIHFVGKPNGRD